MSSQAKVDDARYVDQISDAMALAAKLDELLAREAAGHFMLGDNHVSTINRSAAMLRRLYALVLMTEEAEKA